MVFSVSIRNIIRNIRNIFRNCFGWRYGCFGSFCGRRNIIVLIFLIVSLVSLVSLSVKAGEAGSASQASKKSERVVTLERHLSPMRTCLDLTSYWRSRTGQTAIIDRLSFQVIPWGFRQACSAVRMVVVAINSAPKTVRRSASSLIPRLGSASLAAETSETAASRARLGHSPPTESAMASKDSQTSASRSSTPVRHLRVGLGKFTDARRPRRRGHPSTDGLHGHGHGADMPRRVRPGACGASE